MRFALFIVGLLTSAALVGCAPDLQDEVDDMSTDVATLQQENAVLETDNAALTRALEDLEAQIDALLAELDQLGDENAALAETLDDMATQIATLTEKVNNDEPPVEALPVPLVRVGSDRSSGAYVVAVDGDEITRWELTGSDGISYPYDPVIWAESTGTCYPFTHTGYLTITVWVWQGEQMTCHGAAEGCYPVAVTALDELAC